MASSPDPPKPVDPTTVIQAQEQANRINRATPFGSQTYNGNTLETTLPEGTKTAFGNVSDLAGNKQQLLQRPNGFGDLQNAILGRVNQHYQQPQKSGSQSMPSPLTQINGQPVNSQWNDALARIWSRN